MDPAKLARRARLDRPRLGFYGISVFAEEGRSVAELVRAGEIPHPFLQRTTVERLTAAGFELVPTFQTPHCTVKLGDELSDDQLEERCRELAAAFDLPEKSS